MHLPDLDALILAHGVAPAHLGLIRRAWLQGKALDRGHPRPEHFFPARFRDSLDALNAALDHLAGVHSTHPAADGSTRLLVRLGDGQTVESVLLPREGVCVSTQVGCAVGCTFCMTGREGVTRHLGSAEIVAQVALARARHPVRKVVFMGMGEPSHNLDAVLEAIGCLGLEAGIAHKNLVFSTVGDLRAFERLPVGRVKPALALSLHTTKPALRVELLPRAPRIAPEELVRLANDYSLATGYPVQYQWTLIDGVNDGDDEVDALARLLDGHYAVMNFIPLNALPGSPYRRPSMARGMEMVRALRSRGILATLRYSAGQDVDAGCGQLRARTLAA